jgi:glycosyltransferase involved in cell wall biosynthesis
MRLLLGAAFTVAQFQGMVRESLAERNSNRMNQPITTHQPSGSTAPAEQEQEQEQKPQPRPQPGEKTLPCRLLYSIAAHIGGPGLGRTAVESLIAAENGGYLGKAIGYRNLQDQIPRRKIQSLQWHPIRLAGLLDRADYHGAKRHYLDWITARELRRGEYDLFHGWSGDSLLTLRQAREMGIPTLLDIPTWHRNKGKTKPPLTKTERERLRAPFPRKYLNRLRISRQRMLEEYSLATIILVQSQVARETFLVADIPDERVVNVGRGVDARHFTPPSDPAIRQDGTFRAIFVGSLSRRKGVDTLLQAWEQLNLPNAELLLVGDLQPEIRRLLERQNLPSIKHVGFARDVRRYYQMANVFVFPSTCEGSAKVTFEAGACGLASISTREAGDFVSDGQNGYLIPVGDAEALAERLRHLAEQPDLLRRMGEVAREIVLQNYTWDHFRKKLERAYNLALHSGP